MHLSALLRCHVLSPTGEEVGKVDDVIVRLRGGDLPLVTGLVGKVGGRRVYLSIRRISELTEERVVLAKPKVDLRGFERREGEVLLREDILGHRLIDVADAELVRAWDIELAETDEGWVVTCLDTRRPARFFGLVRASKGHPCQDWKAFEPLIGHTPSVRLRPASAGSAASSPPRSPTCWRTPTSRKARRSSTWCTAIRSWKPTCSRNSIPTSPTSSSTT